MTCILLVSDSSASGVEHACLAFNEINKLTQLDMIANLGDVMKGYMDDINDEGFKFVKQQMDAVAKSVPYYSLRVTTMIYLIYRQRI